MTEQEPKRGTKAAADIAKRLIISGIAQGKTVEKACADAGKSLKAYEYYRSTDKKFADLADRTRLGLKEKNFIESEAEELSFADFRLKYLHQHTFGHQIGRAHV